MITHKQKHRILLIFFVLLAAIWLINSKGVNHAPSPKTPTTIPKHKLKGKTIVWIDSYHKGYAWSNGIEHGIRKIFGKTPVKLISLRLNAKQYPMELNCKVNALKIKQEIAHLAPDAVIASDDHAQKYIIVPYFKNTKTPVVFCGVNWDASEYGYPAKNVTGMIEVDLVKPLMEHLKRYANGIKVAFVSADDLTERKLFMEHNKRFFNGKMLPFLASEPTFKSFCETFLSAQKEADMILLSNNAGITDWNDQKAKEFFLKNTSKPTGAINKWMAGFALVTFSKLPEEQGEWAAETALKILSGTPVSEISMTENKKGKLIINMDIAEKLNIVFPLDILRNADIHTTGKN